MLGRDLRAEADLDEAVVAARTEAKPEALVVLAIDQLSGSIGSNGMAPHLVRPPRVVDARDVDRAAVGRQLRAVADAMNAAVDDIPRCQIGDDQVKTLITTDVDGVCEGPVISAHRECAEREVLVP